MLGLSIHRAGGGDQLSGLFPALDWISIPAESSDTVFTIASHLTRRSVVAAATLLEPSSLSDQRLAACLERCATEAARRDDFRLFIVLKGLRAEDLEAAAVPAMRVLGDAVQFGRWEDREELAAELSRYVRQMSEIVRSSRTRTTYIRVALGLGRAAAALQIAGTLLAVAIWIALQVVGPEGVISALGTFVPTVALAAQLPFFLALWFPVYLLMQPRMALGRDLVRAVAAMFVMWCCFAVADALEVTQAWAMLGQSSGVLLDLLRRKGRHARWRSATLRAIATESRDTLPKDQQAAVIDQRLDPLYWPLVGDPHPRVFISYTNRSSWSVDTAGALDRCLREGKTVAFLDRHFIGKGTNWQRELRRRICDSNVFISLADEMATTRTWTARELETALRGRALTGTPYTILLRPKGSTLRTDSQPVFRTALEPGIRAPGRLEVLDWDEGRSLGSVAWMLRGGHFMTDAVLPPALSRPLRAVGALLTMLAGSLGWIVGLSLLVASVTSWRGVWLDLMASLSLVTLISVWAGFLARRTIAWMWEIRSARPSAQLTHLLATAGFLGILSMAGVGSSILMRGWMVLGLLLGWMAGAPAVDQFALRGASAGVDEI